MPGRSPRSNTATKESNTFLERSSNVASTSLPGSSAGTWVGVPTCWFTVTGPSKTRRVRRRRIPLFNFVFITYHLYPPPSPVQAALSNCRKLLLPTRYLVHGALPASSSSRWSWPRTQHDQGRQTQSRQIPDATHRRRKRDQLLRHSRNRHITRGRRHDTVRHHHDRSNSSVRESWLHQEQNHVYTPGISY